MIEVFVNQRFDHASSFMQSHKLCYLLKQSIPRQKPDSDHAAIARENQGKILPEVSSLM